MLNNHTHNFSATTSISGRHNHGTKTRNGALGSYEFDRPVGWDGQRYRQAVDDAGEHNHNVSGTTGGNNGSTTEAGQNKAHNNLQPYRVVGYMWIRTE